MRKSSLLRSVNWQAVGLFFLILVLFGIAGHFDRVSEEEDRALYCEMVAIWHSDAARGIAPEDRSGWPPYQGECE